MDVITTVLNWIYSYIPSFSSHVFNEDTHLDPDNHLRQVIPVDNTIIDVERTRFLLTPDMLERGIAYHS